VNSAHAEQTIRAAAAGKHVLCEKPMATLVEDCGRMVAACQANGVRLMIAYRKYFEPGSVALKELVTRGKLGRLRHIFSSYTEIVDPGKAKTWQLNQRLAGGGLADGHRHLLCQHYALGGRQRAARRHSLSMDRRPRAL